MSNVVVHDGHEHIIRVYTDPYQLHIRCRSALQMLSINDFKKMIRVVISQLYNVADKYDYLDAWENEIHILAEHIKVEQPEYKARPAISRLIKLTEYINKQRDKLPPKYFYE